MSIFEYFCRPGTDPATRATSKSAMAGANLDRSVPLSLSLYIFYYNMIYHIILCYTILLWSFSRSFPLLPSPAPCFSPSPAPCLSLSLSLSLSLCLSVSLSIFLSFLWLSVSLSLWLSLSLSLSLSVCLSLSLSLSL